jgi:type IV secretion system protein VirD4
METNRGNDFHDLLFGAGTGPGGRADEQERLERAAVIVASALVAVGVLWWLTGQLAAGLTGHGWPGVSASATANALWLWPSHWGNPIAGYPPSTALSKVSPVAWWAVLAVLIATGAVLGRVVWRKLQDREAGRRNRWAKPGDLRDLTVRAAMSGRLVVGRVDRRLVATEKRHSVLVVGPTQSGKTTGLAVPALLEWRGPAVAVSVKTDLAENTLRHRSRQGKVWVYDPKRSTPLRASTWSPLSAVGSWEDATRLAQDLTEAGRAHSGDGQQQAGFWFGLAAQLLAPYLFAAATGGATMGTVYQWVLTHEHEESRALLGRIGHRVALAQHDSMWLVSDQTRSSVFVTLQQSLAVYADTRVAASTATSEIDVGTLLNGGNHTLYVTAPNKDQQALQPLFSSLIGYVLDEAYAKAAKSGPLNPPLLVLVDEAANVAPMRDLAPIASTAASQGIQLVTVWQDLAQVRDRYHVAGNTVLNNHRARVVLRGCGDEETLRWVSTMAGDTVTKSASSSRSSRNGPAIERVERLLPIHEARQMRRFDGVLLYGALPAAKLKLRPWYRDRQLRRLAAPIDSDAAGDQTAGGGSAPDGGASSPADGTPSLATGELSDEASSISTLAERAAAIAASAVEDSAGGDDVGSAPTGDRSRSTEAAVTPNDLPEPPIEHEADIVSLQTALEQRARRLESSASSDDSFEPEPGA